MTKRPHANVRSWITAALFGAALVLPSAEAIAHDTYDGCTPCHGAFDGPTSPQGTVFPSGDKHRMHRSSSYMNTECDLCHMADETPVFIGMSLGTGNNPGLGCTGCHEPLGLRRHHVNAGVSCGPCHADVTPILPEDFCPPYYGTPDTNVFDACNSAPEFNENWSIGDLLGSDNDGDGLYDEASDPDCTPCLGDVNSDGETNVTDLVQVILDWGCDVPSPCLGDASRDCVVNVTDLVQVILDWGPC